MHAEVLMIDVSYSNFIASARSDRGAEAVVCHDHFSSRESSGWKL